MSRKWGDGPYKPQKGVTPEKVIKAPFKLVKGVYDKVLEPTVMAPANIAVEEAARRAADPVVSGFLNKLPRENFSNNFKSIDKPFSVNTSLEWQHKDHPNMHVSQPLQLDTEVTGASHRTKFRPLNLLRGVSPFETHSNYKMDHVLNIKNPVLSDQMKDVMRNSLEARMLSDSLNPKHYPRFPKLGWPDPANHQFPRTSIPWETGQTLDGKPMPMYEPKPKINTERWNAPPKREERDDTPGVAMSPMAGYGKDPKLGLSNFHRVDRPRSLDDL